MTTGQKPKCINMSIVLVPLMLSEIGDYVKFAFDKDEELLTAYHISPGSLDHCVKHTMDFIVKNAEAYKDDMEFFAVMHDGNPIGYTIAITNESKPNELYSFGINIHYRTPDILIQWMDALRELLSDKFIVALWAKNARAIGFFIKNGFVISRTSNYLGDEIKTLKSCLQVGY